jgi:hypothetical protein
LPTIGDVVSIVLMKSNAFLADIGQAFDINDASVAFSGDGALSSVFAVTDLAAASVAAAGGEIAGLVHDNTERRPVVNVDRRLTSFWFGQSMRPLGWELPPIWDSVAGDYETSDGWIRLHTNAAHHRAAALRVLDVEAERAAVTAAVRTWSADDLEHEVVAAGGCAAVMRSQDRWTNHPQGRAVAEEPLVATHVTERGEDWQWRPTPGRPLAGIRVLDLTRILAGPVATRFLAGFGADVLRIDPPGWDEPSVAPDVTLGKRCARLDLRIDADRAKFEDLLRTADVLVHGYRANALERLGLGADRRCELNPSLVDVALCAYGWTGPWHERRGFDSLLQMSSGIAHAGMLAAAAERPVPLPVQALDHATGYLMAAAAIRGVRQRVTSGVGSHWRLSLARTAALLQARPQEGDEDPLAPIEDADFADAIEQTTWGPQRRLKPPLTFDGAPMYWDRPASPLGVAEPMWSS